MTAPLAVAQTGSSPPSPEPTGTSVLVGKIRGAADGGGESISEATVELRPLGGGETRTAVVRRGKYRLETLERGYYALVVRTAAGEFPADRAVAIPPDTKVVLDITLTQERPGPAPDAPTASLSERPRGLAYWKSPKGLAILGGVGAAGLAAIVLSGDDDEDDASPTAP